MSNQSSIDHLLGPTQDTLAVFSDSSLQGFSQDSVVDSDQDASSYKTVRRENHVDCIVPGSKSKGVGSDYKPFDLEKLDVVLGTNSVLPIEVECTLNGLNVLEYPTWISGPLDSVMSKAEFTRTSTVQSVFRYQIEKAFVTTPISYLLQAQAPYGTLDKLYIHLDWSTTTCKQFQQNWSSNQSALSHYVDQLFVSILIRKTFPVFPLIFSDAFVKRVVPVVSHLPRIAQSLQRIIKTSKDTSDHDIGDTFIEKLEMIQQNTQIMKPLFTSKDDLVTHLTLGMYHIASKKSMMPTNNSLLSKSSPNALNAVTKIWSIMVSALPDHES